MEQTEASNASLSALHHRLRCISKQRNSPTPRHAASPAFPLSLPLSPRFMLVEGVGGGGGWGSVAGSKAVGARPGDGRRANLSLNPFCLATLVVLLIKEPLAQFLGGGGCGSNDRL